MAIVLAIILLAWVLAGLAVRVWSSDQAYRITGPTHITAGQGQVVLYAAGELHILKGDGQWLGANPLTRFGFDDDPIDLRLLRDGRLLIAGQRPASIRLCDTSDFSCEGLAPGRLGPIERQYKIHPRGANEWLLTDAAGDQLWRMNSGAGALEAVLPPGTLAGPNGIAMDPEGVPWVADTDHRRLVELLVLPAGGFVTGREHSAHNDLTIGRRHYPMMLEWGADGRFWVVQASTFSEAQADLVAYDRVDGAVDVIPLPEGAYPTDLAPLGKDMVVTDMDRFRVYRVDTASGEVSAFGDAAFQDRMRDHSARRASLQRLGTVSLVFVVLGALALIAAAIRATPPEKRWTRSSPGIDVTRAAAETPTVQGVHWLRQNPKYRWLVQGFERLYYVLFGLLCLVAYLMYAWSCGQPAAAEADGLSGTDRLGLLLLLVCLATASFIPMIHFAAAAFRRRLGTDGRKVLLEFETGRRVSVDPGQLAWNDRAVLYGRHTFPLQTGLKSPLYAENELQTWLAPLLTGAEMLNEWQTVKHQLRHRDRLLVSALSAIFLLGLILVFI